MAILGVDFEGFVHRPGAAEKFLAGGGIRDAIGGGDHRQKRQGKFLGAAHHLAHHGRDGDKPARRGDAKAQGIAARLLG